MEEKETKKHMGERVKEETEKIIDRILEQGIEMANVDFLYKMIDIHKDIANEDYWDVKKEGIKMRYNNYNGNYGKYEDNRYGNYGRRMRDSRGRYMGGYNEYHNDDTMRTLMSSYQAYSDSKDSYGAKGETITNLDYMLQSVVEFMQMLKNDVNSQEEMDLIRHYSKQISEM